MRWRAFTPLCWNTVNVFDAMNMHTPGSPLTVIWLADVSHKYKPMLRYIICVYDRPVSVRTHVQYQYDYLTARLGYTCYSSQTTQLLRLNISLPGIYQYSRPCWQGADRQSLLTCKIDTNYTSYLHLTLDRTKFCKYQTVFSFPKVKSSIYRILISFMYFSTLSCD